MILDYLLPPPPPVGLAVMGSSQLFPVHRIYCVGRNYADHVREMGSDPRSEPPIFFAKPADALVPSGTQVRYPPRTRNLHHEIELVVALGRGGRDLSAADARALVLGYAVGNDLTRRDLQAAAKQAGQPWDVAKGFDASAPVSPLRLAGDTGPLTQGRIWLEVNGVLRQQADIAEMIWSVPEIIAELSSYFELKPGDLIFTGTPAGVGALLPGDTVRGGVDGVGTLEHGIVAP
jgi:fumarylpyruvate hydrolase